MIPKIKILGETGTISKNIPKSKYQSIKMHNHVDWQVEGVNQNILLEQK